MLLPGLIDVLILLPAFYYRIYVSGQPPSPLSCFSDAIFETTTSLVKLHTLAYHSSDISSHQQHLPTSLPTIFTALDSLSIQPRGSPDSSKLESDPSALTPSAAGVKTTIALFSTTPDMISSAASSTSPRFVQVCDERRALVADRALSVSILYYLPTYTSLLPFPQALHIIPSLVCWLSFLDDNRWFSVRSGDVPAKLVASITSPLKALFLYLAPLEEHSSTQYPLIAFDDPQDAFLPPPTYTITPTPTVNCTTSTVTPALAHLGNITSTLCAHSFSDTLSSPRSPLDTTTLRKLLACVYCLAYALPDLSLIPQLLRSLCRYLQRWHKDLLDSAKPPASSEAQPNEEVGDDDTDHSDDGGDWDDWDDDNEGAVGSQSNGSGYCGLGVIDCVMEFLGALDQEFGCPPNDGGGGAHKDIETPEELMESWKVRRRWWSLEWWLTRSCDGGDGWEEDEWGTMKSLLASIRRRQQEADQPIMAPPAQQG